MVEKVECKTPTPGKKPTRIDRWKYVTIRKAILKAVPRKGDGVEFKRLSSLVKKQLTADELKRLGSVSWYTTVVKLDMEVKGELRRLEGSGRQRLVIP